jgi:hypothetical protein
MVGGLAAFLTLALSLTSAPGWRWSDLPFLLFAVSPYLALAALAAGLRRSRRCSWSLFCLAVALSLAGVGYFALDSWTFHTVAAYRMQQRLTVIVVPMLQLAMLAPFALVTLIAVIRLNECARRLCLKACRSSLSHTNRIRA